MSADNQYINVEEVKLTGFNPAKRNMIKPDDPLLLDMRENGYADEYPIVIGSDGLLGDGHRRLACAKIVGVSKIPYKVSSMTATQVMARNAGQLPFKTDMYDVLSKHGVPVPPKIKKNHDQLRHLAGESALDLVIAHGKSSRIVSVLNSALRYMAMKGDQEFGLETLQWILIHAQQRPLIEAMRENVEPRIIYNAIRGNRPLKRGPWYSETGGSSNERHE